MLEADVRCGIVKIYNAGAHSKALAYEAQAKAFGSHSNAVQRTLKAYLKAVRSEIETDNSVERIFYARAPTGSASCFEREGVIKISASDAHQTIRQNNSLAEASDQISNTCEDRTKPSGISKANGEAETKTTASPNSIRKRKSTKPSILSIRAGTHLVREWNGRTYQVEALDKGFRLDGKTYRSLSAIAKKINGVHWSGPRFFGVES